MNRKRGLIVGLTGGMACGKTTVARFLQRLGARTLHSDETVHHLLANDPDVRREALEAFGEGLLDAEGRIDRKMLAKIVFSDEGARQRLMAILHPRTKAFHIAQATRFVEEHPNGVVVIDSPLLFESHLNEATDVTVVVVASYEKQVERALHRAEAQGAPLSREEVERRIALQMPLEEKRSRADYVLENDGTPEELEQQTAALWKKLISSP